MTSKDKITIIAGACPFVLWGGLAGKTPLWYRNGAWIEFDPLDDLNAMHEAEKTLSRDRGECASPSQWDVYKSHLRSLCKQPYDAVGAEDATAEDRADAFIRVMKLKK